MTHMLWLIAQATQAAPTTGGAAPNPTNFYIALGIVMVFLFLWMSRTNKREQKKVQDMLANLKKNDRVQTIGGVLGTVVEVRDNEVVLKVDESNNVRMRFVRGAIKDVLQEAPSEPKSDTKGNGNGGKSGKK